MPRFREVAPNVFLWTDTCNVYVLTNGDTGLLIDLGSGSVLDHLDEIGVRKIEWVLMTHHHREQCQGGARLRGSGIQVAASAIEKPLFETPASFRRMRPTLSDPFTVYGASFVRPPVDPISINRAFSKMDDFTWRGMEIWVIETQGNSPGHTSYLLRQEDRWLVFSGDLMVDGAKFHTWFDTEWDYGFGKGLFELGKSAAQIAGYDPAMMLPSHGPVIREPRRQLNEYVRKLRHLGELYVRGYDIMRFDGCDQDNISRPTAVPHVWQVTPHLYKFRGPNYWVNFAILLADNGHALIVDCGLFNLEFLDKSLTRMQERLGLKKIDAVFVTHMHGDHAMDANHVRQKYGAELWTMEGVADKFERPWDHDLAALLPFYQDKGKEFGPLKFDRILKNGAILEWEGHTFCCDWMPGQTKYHACLHGEVDGRRVAFTGDNICLGTDDPKHGGNEAVVARNGGTLEEGYLYAANFLHSIAPEIIIGGHCWAIGEPEALIERYRQRIVALREAFQSLSVEEDYRYGFDPYWVQVAPYRVMVAPGKKTECQLVVRNYLSRPQRHRLTFHLSSHVSSDGAATGVSVQPNMVEFTLPAGSSITMPLFVVAEANATRGLHLVAINIQREGQDLGQLFDFIAHVGDVA